MASACALERAKRKEEHLKQLQIEYPDLYEYCMTCKNQGNVDKVDKVDENERCERWDMTKISNLPKHFIIERKRYNNNHVSDGLDDILRQASVETSNITTMNKPRLVGIWVKDKLYICGSRFEYYDYPADLFVSRVFENVTTKDYEHYKWLGSLERQKKLRQEIVDAHRAEVEEFWKQHIKPIYKKFKSFVEELTIWFFKTEWLKMYIGTEPEWTSWINFEELAKSGHWRIAELMMDFAGVAEDVYDGTADRMTGRAQDISIRVKELESDNPEADWYDLTYRQFYDNFPYWRAVFEMAESNVKTEFPNGDCYCGSQEQTANEQANMRLFAFYYDNVYPNIKASKKSKTDSIQ